MSPTFVGWVRVISPFLPTLSACSFWPGAAAAVTVHSSKHPRVANVSFLIRIVFSYSFSLRSSEAGTPGWSKVTQLQFHEVTFAKRRDFQGQNARTTETLRAGTK